MGSSSAVHPVYVQGRRHLLFSVLGTHQCLHASTGTCDEQFSLGRIALTLASKFKFLPIVALCIFWEGLAVLNCTLLCASLGSHNTWRGCLANAPWTSYLGVVDLKEKQAPSLPQMSSLWPRSSLIKKVVLRLHRFQVPCSAKQSQDSNNRLICLTLALGKWPSPHWQHFCHV